MATAALGVAAPPSAFAQTSPPPGTPFGEAFGTVFLEQSARLLQCVGLNATGGLTTVAFLGATPPAIHLSDSRRRDLNDAAIRAIDATGVYDAVATEPTCELVPLLQGSAGSVQLQKTLAAFSTAPVIAKFRLGRPDVDLLQLQIDLIGRNPDGAYSCTQTASLYLQPATLAVAAAPANDTDRNLTHLTGAYRDGLRKLLPQLRASDQLAVTGEADLSGTCGLKTNLIDTFGSTYFELKREAPSLGEIDAPWPKISFSAEPQTIEGYRLHLRLLPSPLDARIVSVVMDLTQGTTTLDRQQYRAVVELAELKGCEPPEPKVEPKAQLGACPRYRGDDRSCRQ